MTPKHDPAWLKAARKKGGHARAKKLTKAQRIASARHAALSRWDAIRDERERQSLEREWRTGQP